MNVPFFPHQRLGLRSNPFRVLTDAEWANVVVLDPSVEEALQKSPHYLQIQGDAGTGKSSTLRKLAHQFAHTGLRVGYEYIPDGQHTFTSHIEANDIALIDEVQRLNLWHRHRLLRLLKRHHPLRLIIGTHQDMTPLFHRYHLPLASVLLERATDERLAAIIHKRLTYFALPERTTPQIHIPIDSISNINHHCAGNLRCAERVLYEIFQSLRPPGLVTPEIVHNALALA